MSIETPIRTPATAATSPEQRQRQRALEWLRSLALEVVLAAEEPLRITDLARGIAERLGLQLNEAEGGAFASLVRLILDSDPTFGAAHRLWDLATRTGRANVDTRRPVERAMEDFLRQLGRPATPDEVGAFIAAGYGRDPEYYAGMIRRLVRTSERLFQVPGDRVASVAWLLNIQSTDPEDVELDNFEADPTVLEPAQAAARQAKGENPLAYATALVNAATEPLPSKALAYVVWRQFPDTEPQALFNDLLLAGNLSLLPGPAWMSATHREQLIRTIRDLTTHPEQAAELLATVLPAEEEALTVEVTSEDLDQVFAYMERDLERSHRLSELCQNVLESFPGSRTYTAMRESLEARLKADARFVWVGAERFRLDGTLPSDIETLPEGLGFDERAFAPLEGEEAEKEIPPERWKFNLDEQVLHPLIQDVGDDDLPFSTERPETLRCSPLLHHYIAGTFYVANPYRGLFPLEPDLVELTLVTDDGSRIEVWLNNRLGLLYGLKEWYDANLPWMGGLFHLRPTEEPDEYRLSNAGEREPLLDIPMERLQELLMLRSEAEMASLPLTEIIRRILRHHAEGAHFVRLFAELNVVRRTRRAALASVLSSQRYFVQNPQEPGIWRFDEKRAEKAGRKKGGPRRPRVIEEEEELWEEEEE